MRAYQLPQASGIDALVKVDLPTPKPGPRQVLIKVAACSLNFRDLAIALGTYRMPTKPSVVPLSDGAGEVVEIGTGVTRVKVGDRVAGCFFQRWIGGPPAADTHTSALGGSIDGMLREYAVLEEDGVVKLPTHLSFEEGATLLCAGVTAWHALVEHAHLLPGQAVLIQGTGGVSIFALQFARLMATSYTAAQAKGGVMSGMLQHICQSGFKAAALFFEDREKFTECVVNRTCFFLLGGLHFHRHVVTRERIEGPLGTLEQCLNLAPVRFIQVRLLLLGKTHQDEVAY